MTGDFVADHSEQTEERGEERDHYYLIFYIHFEGQ